MLEGYGRDEWKWGKKSLGNCVLKIILTINGTRQRWLLPVSNASEYGIHLPPSKPFANVANEFANNEA